MVNHRRKDMVQKLQSDLTGMVEKKVESLVKSDVR